jgi:hypothetical protein
VRTPTEPWPAAARQKGTLMGTAPVRVADAEIVQDAQRVVVALKTPLDRRPVTAALLGDLTLERAVVAMRKAIPIDDVDGRHVLANVEREMAASRVDFLVIRQGQEVVNAQPTTLLRDIATPHEMRTSKGLKTVPAVAFEVQAYAGVGT